MSKIDVGTPLRDYEIVARLRSGGMGVLFLGRRRGPGGFSRYVAIKAIHPHLADDPATVAMFLEEARLAARVEHPNVLQVEELGEKDGGYYLVMPYVHGCSLAQLTRELAVQHRRLTVEQAVYIVAQVADGLHAVHEARGDDGGVLGLVHRDVSPKNVLLSRTGHVKLIDFGIAKVVGKGEQTRSGGLKGTPRYMAPEQVLRRPIDRRTDLFALGIVLWELLTMRKLFDADDSLALLDMIRAPDIVPPRTLAPWLSPALQTAVLSALATDPCARPPTTEEWRTQLLDAVPEALGINASHLARMLSDVMGALIERDAARLGPDAEAQAAGGGGGGGGNAQSTLRLPVDGAEETLATVVQTSIASEFARDEGSDPGSSSEAETSPPRPVVARDTARPRWLPAALVLIAAVAGVALAAVGLSARTRPVATPVHPAPLASPAPRPALATPPPMTPDVPATPSAASARVPTAPPSPSAPIRAAASPHARTHERPASARSRRTRAAHVRPRGPQSGPARMVNGMMVITEIQE